MFVDSSFRRFFCEVSLVSLLYISIHAEHSFAVWGNPLGGCHRSLFALRSSSLGELRDDLAKVLAVVHGHLLLVLGRLARAVAPRDRAAAVGRAAVDLGQIEEQGGRVAHRHEEHAVVGKLGDEGQGGRLLPAVLGAGREEDARRLADKLRHRAHIGRSI